MCRFTVFQMNYKITSGLYLQQRNRFGVGLRPLSSSDDITKQPIFFQWRVIPCFDQ